jgi:peptide/nickel transport system ATP-binding protein
MNEAVSTPLPSATSVRPLFDVRGLRVWFVKDRTFSGRPRRYVKAVDDVSFHIAGGETLAIVGESGSGKTTTGLAILRAIDPREGEIWFSPDGRQRYDLASLSRREIRPLRRYFQMIFQDPFSSLNPRMTVRQIIAEPLKVNRVGTPEEQTDTVRRLLDEVGLNIEFLNRYPHAFSGGQRQRIVIARALALSPALIVCDEPVSALDVSVQAQILNLMVDLKERHRLAYLFVAHDLHVVRHIADRVAVMYAGRLVEEGSRDDLFDRPLHPYTSGLLASVPQPDPRKRRKRQILAGEVPDPSNLPSGCVFHPRCPRALELCRREPPPDFFQGAHRVRCWLYRNDADRI